MVHRHSGFSQRLWPGLLAGLLLTACRDSPELEPSSGPLDQADETTLPAPLEAGPGDADSPFAKWEETDDPEEDGWESEVFNESAGAVLKKLGAALLAADADGATKTEVLFHPSAVFHTYAADAPQTTAKAPGDFRVTLRSSPIEPGAAGTESHTGPAAILAGLRVRYTPDRPEPVRFKPKITSVERQEEGSVKTTVRIEGFGIRNGEAVERLAHWRIDWVDAEPPLIAAITVLDEELVARPHEEALLFTDCTRSALEDDPAWGTQVLRGFPYWKARRKLERSSELYGFNGIAVGDVNGDGREDLFYAESRAVPNRLFLQQADGTLADAAAEWGVDWLEDTRSALLVDLDNDGDDDLAAATIGFVVVAENTGERFRFAAALPCNNDVNHLCTADADLDGRLDLYVCAYFRNFGSPGDEVRDAHPSLYIDSGRGARNTFFRNATTNGEGWIFEDQTEAVGLDQRNGGQTLSAAWEDFDGDGDPDLYVANDFGTNRLYRNDRSEDGALFFTEISDEAGSGDTNFGMSAAWGDPDRDGHPDLHISNMWSSAGKRVVSREQFKPDLDGEERDFYLSFARGNTLLKNLGDGTFDDVSEEAGITMGRWAWSSPWTDFNNDGWEDLVVANGYVTGTGPGDL